MLLNDGLERKVNGSSARMAASGLAWMASIEKSPFITCSLIIYLEKALKAMMKFRVNVDTFPLFIYLMGSERYFLDLKCKDRIKITVDAWIFEMSEVDCNF